jgi:hypothetical protein
MNNKAADTALSSRRDRKICGADRRSAYRATTDKECAKQIAA